MRVARWALWFRRRTSGGTAVEHEVVKLDSLVRGFGGQWVAIKDGAVVGAARTMDELLLRLKDSQLPGVRNATIMRVRAEDEEELVGLG